MGRRRRAARGTSPTRLARAEFGSALDVFNEVIHEDRLPRGCPGFLQGKAEDLGVRLHHPDLGGDHQVIEGVPDLPQVRDLAPQDGGIVADHGCSQIALHGSDGLHQGQVQPIAGNDLPRFAGIATFMRLPHVLPADAVDDRL